MSFRNRIRRNLVESLVLFVPLMMMGCSDPASTEGAPLTDLTISNADNGIDPTPEVQCTINNSMVATGVLPEQMPANLTWETNDTEEEFAAPEAQRGGTYRTYVLSFPLTFRLVGPDANGGFASFIRALHLGTTTIHPNSLRNIPQLATHWAFGEDGRSIYYKINPKARWSDGKPITADDFLFQVYLFRNKDIVDPWYNDYYSNIIVDVRKYDDHTFAIAGVSPRPRDEMLVDYGLRPSACHAHKIDKDWVKRHNFLIEPVSGPYRISKVKKGQFVEFERIDDWWGNDERYYQHRFNVKTVRVNVISDPELAWKYFLKGDIDSFPINIPEFWHERATGSDFDLGYIRKTWLFTDSPTGGNGFWINSTHPILSDRNVRLALAHATNWDKVINTVLRGDYVRSNGHFEGFGDYSDPNQRALPFDLDAADRYLKASGWNQRGSDGIRTKDGQRLSFQLTYGSALQTDRLTILREEARKAGIDLRLQLLDSAAAFKLMREKKHEIAYSAWAGGSLVPALWEYYHSDNADKVQTNNVSNYRDPITDEMIDEFRQSTDRARRVELSIAIQKRTADAAVMIPATRAPFVRDAHWRWLKLPPWHGTRLTGYGLSSGLFDPLTDGLFWIDEAERQRTQEAMRTRQPLSAEIVKDERYRQKSPSLPSVPTNS